VERPAFVSRAVHWTACAAPVFGAVLQYFTLPDCLQDLVQASFVLDHFLLCMLRDAYVSACRLGLDAQEQCSEFSRVWSSYHGIRLAR
jgi:hypothetical protein